LTAMLASSSSSTAVNHLSTSLLIALVILGVVELALIVFALVSLVKRPMAGVRFHTKWPWAVLIVVVGWIGPIVYFAAGRVDIPVNRDGTPGTATTARRGEDAADVLYGPKEKR